MTVTQTLAAFIVGLQQTDRIPAAVLEKPRHSLLNCYGLGLASFATTYGPIAARAALAIDG